MYHAAAVARTPPWLTPTSTGVRNRFFAHGVSLPSPQGGLRTDILDTCPMLMIHGVSLSVKGHRRYGCPRRPSICAQYQRSIRASRSSRRNSANEAISRRSMQPCACQRVRLSGFPLPSGPVPVRWSGRLLPWYPLERTSLSSRHPLDRSISPWSKMLPLRPSRGQRGSRMSSPAWPGPPWPNASTSGLPTSWSPISRGSARESAAAQCVRDAEQEIARYLQGFRRRLQALAGK